MARTDFELKQQTEMFLRARERAPSFGFQGLKGAALARAMHARFDLCAGVGIKLGSQDPNYNASHCIVVGNQCADTRAPGSKTQEYGIAQTIVAGVFNYTSHIDIADNVLNNNKLGAFSGTTAQMSFKGPTVWGSASFTPGTLAPSGYAVVSVPVSGARTGDMLMASFDQVLGPVSLQPCVVSDDTVFVQFTNNDAANAMLGAGTVRVSASKPPTYGVF